MRELKPGLPTYEDARKHWRIGGWWRIEDDATPPNVWAMQIEPWTTGITGTFLVPLSNGIPMGELHDGNTKGMSFSPVWESDAMVIRAQRDITDRARKLIHDTTLYHPDSGPQAWADLTDDQRAYWIAMAKQETP